MRRILATAIVAALAAVVALVISSAAQGNDSYTFDIIFDDARGLIAGQTVKIAGAAAGTIDSVSVTSDFKARVRATVDGAFRFHTDATCTIRPDGLIAENYVECDPGSASKPLLAGAGGEPPTVPVTQTTEPVELLDLFNIFNLPTSERLTVLIDELGISTSARGGDINAILERANPTLRQAQQVISILNAQDGELMTAISATNKVAAEGAANPAAIRIFLQKVSSLTQLTADHSGNLATGFNRLPSLLGAAQPALTDLNTVLQEGTPLLKELRAAVPSIDSVNASLPQFTKLAEPALSALAGAVNKAIPTFEQVTPLVKTVNNYVSASTPSAKLFSQLAVNLIQRGFSENFLSVAYYTASATARYDSDSHVLSTLLMLPDDGACFFSATTPSSETDCQARWGNVGSQTSSDVRAASGEQAPDATAAAARTPGTAKTGESGSLGNLLDYLLR